MLNTVSEAFEICPDADWSHSINKKWKAPRGGQAAQPPRGPRAEKAAAVVLAMDITGYQAFLKKMRL